MSIPVIIFALIGAIVIVGAVGAWMYDARRNKRVADNEDRFDQP